MRSRCASLLLCLLVAACGDPASLDPSSEGSTTPPYVRPEEHPSLLANMVEPVRIGELGPNFAACNARGATRDRRGADRVPVRAAPFEQSEPIASLPAGSQFFICSRTNDQRWFGIVYDEDGSASERCGVSAPLPVERNYSGPCAAGWVPSASVRLDSGIPHQMPAQTVTAPPSD